MLAIRMQRTGRKGHAMFRLVVQESRLTPTSGKVVVTLGSYDPHTKAAAIDKEKAAFYLKNGAQPSDRAARLLKVEGVDLPSWVKDPSERKRPIRNTEKLRKNQPKEEAVTEIPAEEPSAPVETTEEKPAETPEA